MPGFGSRVAQLIDQPHELELEAREHLAELVVKLAGDARALFLSRELQSKRERMKPLTARGDARAPGPPAWRRRVASSSKCSPDWSPSRQ